MVNRTSFEAVVDGDELSQGYFNGSANLILSSIIQSNIANGLSESDFTNYLLFNNNNDNVSTDKDAVIGNGKAYFCEIIDDFNDGVVDTNLWTPSNDYGHTSSWIETGGLIKYEDYVGGNAYESITCDGVNSIDFKSSSSDSLILLNYYHRDNDVEFVFSLTDGTNDVDIYSVTGQIDDFLAIYIDNTNNLAYYSVNEGSWSSGVDISGLTKYNIKIKLNNPSGANHHVYSYLRSVGYISPGFNSGNTASITYSRTLNNNSNTLIINPVSVSGSLTYEASFDGGSTYESLSSNILHTNSTTGTDFKLKVSTSLPSNISLGTAPDLISFEKIGVIYV